MVEQGDNQTIVRPARFVEPDPTHDVDIGQQPGLGTVYRRDRPGQRPLYLAHDGVSASLKVLWEGVLPRAYLEIYNTEVAALLYTILLENAREFLFADAAPLTLQLDLPLDPQGNVISARRQPDPWAEG